MIDAKIDEPPRRCLVFGCENSSDRGGFVGELCAPCRGMLSTGMVRRGRTFVHAMADALAPFSAAADWFNGSPDVCQDDYVVASRERAVGRQEMILRLGDLRRARAARAGAP